MSKKPTYHKIELYEAALDRYKITSEQYWTAGSPGRGAGRHARHVVTHIWINATRNRSDVIGQAVDEVKAECGQNYECNE